MDVKKFFLLITIVAGVRANCTTPRNENGICVPLRNCSSLLELAQAPTVSAETKAFLRSSVCERTNQKVIVCCPVTPESPCTDPYGDNGSCVQLQSCPKIKTMSENKDKLNEAQLRFLKSSRCSPRHEKVKVCCSSRPAEPLGNPAEPDEPASEIGNNALLMKMRLKRLPVSPDCGISLSDRIFGGSATKYDEFLWTVALNYRNPLGRTMISCGGTIINERYILTAAHCVEKVSKKWLLESVRIGDWDLTTDEDCDPNDERNCLPAAIDFEIEEKIVHEGYNKSKSSSPNDIALLRLSDKIQFNGLIKPICLPYDRYLWNKNYTGKSFTTTGWGLTEEHKASNIKRKVKLPYVSEHRCNDVLSANNIKLLDSQLCAGGEYGKDSCAGDSGGPLMSQNLEDQLGYWYITGITSYGTMNCGTDSIPGIYTRVASYLDWIVEKIKK